MKDFKKIHFSNTFSASCNYPIKYGVSHKDECFSFRYSKSEDEPNPFERPLEEAEQNCQKSLG